MKLGFLTACLPNVPLEQLVKYASAVGFQALEVSAWPVVNSREYAGSSLDVGNFNLVKADKLQELFTQNQLTISSLAYYENNLHHDEQIRETNITHLKKVIDAAGLLGVELVGTFIGRDITKTVTENMDQFERVFSEIIDYAEARKVRIMIENCPMPGWGLEGSAGTISYSPELWRELFRRIPSVNFGLNLDPSHLYWLGIDYLKATREFKERIFQVHAKDTVVFKERLYEFGVYGKQLDRHSNWDNGGWWSYRMPGRGEIDWLKFMNTLAANEYRGVLSIEHEDPEFEGSEAKVKEGLEKGYRYLAPLIKN